uniref:protein-tyrosine-phosphatase n=1 Tax=Macrostomum lignano TaxID=282301 RepID=A0A1I8IGN3_9PLAT
MSPTQPQPPPLSPPSIAPVSITTALEFAAYAKKLLADAAASVIRQYSLMKQAAIEQTKSFSTEGRAENCGSYIVRKLRLMPNTDDKTDAPASGMDTELLQYMEWEDHAVPNLDNLAEFLGRVHRSQRNGGGGRIVLHCSAGVGRTGTFIALDLLARRLQDCQERQEVSVYETVLQLRRCRVDMVQTKHQYAFIYKFLLNFVQKKPRISAFNGPPPHTAAAGRDNEAFDATNEA